MNLQIIYSKTSINIHTIVELHRCWFGLNGIEIEYCLQYSVSIPFGLE